MRNALVATTLLTMLTACASPAYQPGSRFDVPGENGKYLVHIEANSSAANQRCADFYRQIGFAPQRTFGCAVWRNPNPEFDNLDIVTKALTLPAGYSCVVVAGPYEWLVQHELEHCGADDHWAWH